MPLLFIIFSPLIASIVSFFVKSKVRTLEFFALAAATIELLAGFIITAGVLRNGSYSFTHYFLVDSLGAILMMIVGLVGFIVSWYAISYLRTEVLKQVIGFSRVKQFYILLNLFLMAMFFAIISTSPIMMWISIEATTLSTAFLISFYNKPSAMEAAWKYLIINSVGLLLGFLGTLLFLYPVLSTGYQGLISWQAIMANASGFNPFIAKIAFIFVLIGYGTKVGLVPMHTWLPDAHSKAPVPISSLLSGVLLNVAFFAILRFKAVVDVSVGLHFSQNLLILFGTLSIIVAAFIIFIQKNYKRLLAYSSIEHMGIIALGFGFGGIGAFGAMLHMIYHSLAKSILFLSAGNIFLRYSSTKIVNVKGVLSALPITGVIFFIGFLTITGVPPFGIFLSETYVLSAGIMHHFALTIVVLFSLALVFVGFLRHIVAMVFGKPEEAIVVGERVSGTILPLIIMVVILAMLGVFIPAPLKLLINSAVSIY